MLMQISKLSTYSVLAHLKGGIVNFETIINGIDFQRLQWKKKWQNVVADKKLPQKHVRRLLDKSSVKPVISCIR